MTPLATTAAVLAVPMLIIVFILVMVVLDAVAAAPSRPRYVGRRRYRVIEGELVRPVPVGGVS